MKVSVTCLLMIPRFLSLKVKEPGASISGDGWMGSLPGTDLTSIFSFMEAEKGGRF